MRARRGFTLIEMLIVIAVILILVSFLVVFVSHMVERSRYSKTRALIDMLDKGCAAYKVDFGVYPPNNLGDSRCFHKHLGRDRFIKTQHTDEGDAPERKLPPIIEFKTDFLMASQAGPPDPDANPLPVVDSWENLVRYEMPGQFNKAGVDIWSAGANGMDEKDPAHADFDDVTNWQKDF